MKSKTYIFKHQYVHNPAPADESTMTTPDLVLSMRDVYRKYVLTGSIEGLGQGRKLVQDDRLFEDFPEETVDTLMRSQALRESAIDELRTRQQSKGPSGQEDKPSNAGEKESDKDSSKPQKDVPDGDAVKDDVKS